MIVAREEEDVVRCRRLKAYPGINQGFGKHQSHVKRTSFGVEELATSSKLAALSEGCLHSLGSAGNQLDASQYASHEHLDFTVELPQANVVC